MKKIISENLLRNVIKFQLVEHYKKKLLKEVVIKNVTDINDNTKKDLFYDFLKFFHTYLFVPNLNAEGKLSEDFKTKIKAIKDSTDPRRVKLKNLMDLFLDKINNNANLDITYAREIFEGILKDLLTPVGNRNSEQFEISKSIYFRKSDDSSRSLYANEFFLIVGAEPFDYKNIVTDFYAGVKNVDKNSMKGYFTDDDIVECMQEIFEDYENMTPDAKNFIIIDGTKIAKQTTLEADFTKIQQGGDDLKNKNASSTSSTSPASSASPTTGASQETLDEIEEIKKLWQKDIKIQGATSRAPIFKARNLARALFKNVETDVDKAAVKNFLKTDLQIPNEAALNVFLAAEPPSINTPQQNQSSQPSSSNSPSSNSPSSNSSSSKSQSAQKAQKPQNTTSAGEEDIFKIPKLKGGYYSLAKILNDEPYSIDVTGAQLRKKYKDKALFVGDRIDLSDIKDKAVEDLETDPKIYSFKNPDSDEDVFAERKTIAATQKKLTNVTAPVADTPVAGTSEVNKSSVTQPIDDKDDLVIGATKNVEKIFNEFKNDFRNNVKETLNSDLTPKQMKKQINTYYKDINDGYGDNYINDAERSHLKYKLGEIVKEEIKKKNFDDINLN